MLQLDPNGPHAEPVDAATLLICRASTREPAIELFFVRRHAQSPFLGGAVVFPGGKVDPSDSVVGPTSGIPPRSLAVGEGFARDEQHARALCVCACRESLEEAGIIPTLPNLGDADIERLRAELGTGKGLDELATSLGLRIDTAALVPFARWITPEAESRRFDARFFMVAVPDGQSGKHDDRETVSAVWATPRRMLTAFASGDVFLAPPTLRALELLCEIDSVDEAMALARRQSLRPICPRFVPGDPPMLTIPGDPEHELSDVRVAGPTRFVLRDGRFVSEEAPGRDPRDRPAPR
jgi:8-oxo-dGTP pyrophosphatase MutT (NUDIX family)